MNLPVIVRPEASADAKGTHGYLEAERAGLGKDFLVRLDRIWQQIGQHPQSYAAIWRNVRAVRIRPFAYVAYYRVLDDRIEVLAIMHGHRRDSEWKRRARR